MCDVCWLVGRLKWLWIVFMIRFRCFSIEFGRFSDLFFRMLILIFLSSMG